MRSEDLGAGIQVLTDHRGCPVAISEGPVWWMVADVETTEAADSEKSYWLQLTNGQQLIACHDTKARRWSVTWRAGMDARDAS